MRISLFQICFLVSISVFSETTLSQEKSSGLQCVADQISSCKIRNSSVNASALSQYSKEFNCIKYGSTSGTKFDFKVPLPEVGMVGLGFGNSAQHSSQTCQEEIKKLDSSSFVKTYSEVFSADCGKTLVGQYEQCLKAKVALEAVAPPTPQSFQCNAVQSERNLVINLRYTPAMGESPHQYTVGSVIGVSGMTCEKGVVAGTYYPTSMHCQIPKDVMREVAIVRLENSVSCQVPLQPERSIELNSARKNSCASILGNSNALGDLPKAVLYGAIGMCDSCLAVNLKTPDSDQRSLTNRLRGCLVWSAKSIMDTAFCNAAPMAAAGLLGGGLDNPFPGALLGAPGPIGVSGPAGGYGNPFSPPGTPPLNPNVTSGYIPSLMASNGEIQFKTQNAGTLCNTKSGVEVLQRYRSSTEAIPIDYLATTEGQNPMFRALIEAVDAALK